MGRWPEAPRGEAGSPDRDLGVNLDSATSKVCVGGKPRNPLSLKLLCKIGQRGLGAGIEGFKAVGGAEHLLRQPLGWGLHHTVWPPWRPRHWTSWTRNSKTRPH